jgi:hypothetical protein
MPQSDEIDELDRTPGGLEHCREDQRAVQIMALDSVGGIGRRIIHRPCSGSPRRAAKQAAESNRGRHSQSIDPLRPTSAAVAQLLISA